MNGTDVVSNNIDTNTEEPARSVSQTNGNPATLTLFGVTMPRDAAYYVVDLACLLLLIASFLVVALAVSWDAYVWRFYVAFGCFMLFCIVVAEVNHRNKFESMTAWFHRWRYPLIGAFFLLALFDFILLELSDVQSDCDWDDSVLIDNCPLLNPDEHGVRYITRFVTITCAALFLCCIMGYWERVSYFSAHNSWVIAILYMSVVGAVFLYFARCLEPPPSTPQDRKYKWSWHQRRNKNQVFKIIVYIMVVVVLFFVIMGSIILSLFGDASRSSESLGTWAAMIIFIIIAHVIMITPLAPGSVVDVCAGFLFVSLFVNNENTSIEAAFIASLVLTICLHFSGSCAQYYVGKIPAVQIWANKSLPPTMLAATDSILKTANWFKVGVVGQVFMDTANGLNQGRMDMAFCTQFWSEYASIPNAIGLVSLGTILAIPSFGSEAVKNFEWAEDAIPLVIMITSLWQMIASSWGAKELLASSGTVSFWTSLEKWSTVQYFYSKGYVPTHEGWKNDCYQLGSKYFDVIQAYRVQDLEQNEQFAQEVQWLQMRDFRGCAEFCKSLFSEPTDPGAQRRVIAHQKQLDEKLNTLREEHWDALCDESHINELLLNKQIEEVEKEVKIENYFAAAEGVLFIAHLLLCLGIFLSGVGSYVLIARNIELAEAVKEGVAVLGVSNVSVGGWVCLILFWALVIVYFHREFKHDCLSTVHSLGFICKGCNIEGSGNIESVFNPPPWQNAPDEYKEVVKNINAAKGGVVVKEIIVNVEL